MATSAAAAVQAHLHDAVDNAGTTTASGLCCGSVCAQPLCACAVLPEVFVAQATDAQTLTPPVPAHVQPHHFHVSRELRVLVEANRYTARWASVKGVVDSNTRIMHAGGFSQKIRTEDTDRRYGQKIRTVPVDEASVDAQGKFQLLPSAPPCYPFPR